MEYSVGSLADLISGETSDNKTKVVQKSFKKLKKVQGETNNQKPRPKKQPQQNVEEDILRSNVEEKDLIKMKKKVKKQKLKGSKIEKINSSKQNSENELDAIKKGKRLKRKAEKTNGHLIDSDLEESPKKRKLNTIEDSGERAANRIKNKFNKEIKNSSEYKDKTLFVGNIPIAVSKEKIKKHFRKYGIIDSVRIRGIAVADVKTSKKVAAMKKEFHPQRNSVCAFIRFKSSEDAKSAEAENGSLFFDHHLRVQFCESEDKPDESKAIFIGNLPFTAEDEELWNLFKICGPISHVRIVRDGRTGIGKGFGYVNFMDSDSVQFALERETFVLKDRQLRISLCEANRAKKQLKKKPRNRERSFNSKEQGNGEQQPNGNKAKDSDAKALSFTGTKFSDIKKKKKFDRGNLEKKNLAKKLSAPKKRNDFDV